VSRLLDAVVRPPDFGFEVCATLRREKGDWKMPIELTCPCGKRLQAPDDYSGRQGRCPACGRLLTIPGRNDAVAGVVPFSDKAAQAVAAAPELPGPKHASAPEGAVTPTAGPAPELRNGERGGSGIDDNRQLTGLGCVVTLLSIAVVFGVAVPIVRWRDPETGQPLPRFVAIMSPLLIGATLQAIVSLFLRFLGFPIWKERETDVKRCRRPVNRVAD
jgi:hypothetical protein